MFYRVVGGIALYVGSAYGFYVWQQSKGYENEPPVDVKKLNLNKAALYRDLAKQYDSYIASDERWMLMPYLRNWLIQKAEGKVLEVAGGTGRNFEYYKEGCEVTFTDSSLNMLKEAKKKLKKYQRNGKTKAKFALELQDAEHLPYQDNSFDTVVDTFGICSVDEPFELLREMQRVCKDGGKILLLEHGASSYKILRNLQAKSAVKHYEKWGCVFNRNIAQIVEDSDSDVVSLKTWHLGTTHIIVATPKKEKTAGEVSL